MQEWRLILKGLCNQAAFLRHWIFDIHCRIGWHEHWWNFCKTQCFSVFDHNNICFDTKKQFQLSLTDHSRQDSKETGVNARNSMRHERKTQQCASVSRESLICEQREIDNRACTFDSACCNVLQFHLIPTFQTSTDVLKIHVLPWHDNRTPNHNIVCILNVQLWVVHAALAMLNTMMSSGAHP